MTRRRCFPPQIHFRVVFGDSIVSVVCAQRRDYPMFLTTPSSTEHQLRLRPEEQNCFAIGFGVEVSIKSHPILRRHGHIVHVLHSRLPSSERERTEAKREVSGMSQIDSRYP